MLRIEVQGVSKVIAALKARRTARTVQDAAIRVGYRSEKAIFLHEDLPSKYAGRRNYTTPGTGPKFLEKVLKNHPKLKAMVRLKVASGKSLREALQEVGEAILAESKPLTPKDSGELRESGFVSVE